MVDIRQRPEFAAGHVPGALHVELGALTEATGAVPDQPVQTYYIMAGSFLSGPGGNLVLNASESHPPEPVHVDVTLDEVGSVDPRTGTAWLSGTVTCTGAELVDLFGELRQRAGRAIITGWGFDSLPCEADTPFTLEIQGQNGLFAGGRADALVDAFACNEEECGFDVVEQEVRLRGGGPR